MINLRGFCFICWGLTLAIGAAGCSSESEEKANTPTTTKSVSSSDSGGKSSATSLQDKLTAGGVEPAKNDTLMLSYSNDPDTVNILTGSDTVSEAFQRWVYEALADRKNSDPDEWVPSLAEKWEFDEPTLTFTIHLRKGVKWHPINLPNGKPLPRKEFTARDVKFTFDCILNTNIDAAHLRSYYEDPDAKDESQRYKIKVSVVDDYTIKVKWSKPYFLAEEFTLGIPIMPRHVYSVDKNGEPISLDFTSREFAEGFNSHWANRLMCGTGPMIFKEWVKEQQVVLERNDEYWGEPFYFSRARFRNIPNPNTVRQELLQNNLDWAGIPEKDQYLQTKKEEAVKDGKVKLVEYTFPAYRYIGYNFKHEFFKERKVRQALSHAVPVQKIIDDVYKGLARRTTGPTLLGSSSYDSSLPEISFDLEKSRQLLSEAGWEDSNGDGIRDKTIDNVRVDAAYELMVYADSPQFATIGEIIKENSRKIGVRVAVAPTKWALMLQKLRKKEFDAAMLGWAMGWKQDLFQIWHSSQADIPDSSNAIGYRNPELDKLIEELRVTLDQKKQVELYHKMHRIIYDDQPYTFLFLDQQTGGYDARLKNIHFYKLRPCIDIREWSATSPRIVGQ